VQRKRDAKHGDWNQEPCGHTWTFRVHPSEEKKDGDCNEEGAVDLNGLVGAVIEVIGGVVQTEKNAPPKDGVEEPSGAAACHYPDKNQQEIDDDVPRHV